MSSWVRRGRATRRSTTKDRASGDRHRTHHRGRPRDIGVAEQPLGWWGRDRTARMDDPPNALGTYERAELDRLRIEVAELRMDRELLKNQRPSSSWRTQPAHLRSPWRRPGLGRDCTSIVKSHVTAG